MFTVLFHEAICKFYLFSLVLLFKENTFNLVVDTNVLHLHPIRSCSMCLPLWSSQNKLYNILSCLSAVFWNLTKAYNFKGEARLLFCVQRGQLNYCGWHCGRRLVRLVLCFNL